MEPFTGVTGDAVALAVPGKVYVLNLPHGGTASVDLRAAKTSLTARWFNPRTGTSREKFDVPKGNWHSLTAPDLNDWSLEIRALDH
jgi:hypothetical protein